MFKAEIASFGGLDTVRLSDSVTGEYVSVVPRFGANVNGLVLAGAANTRPVLRGNRQAVDFSGKGMFRGAKLLPFPNRIRDGRYMFAGKEYQLGLNYPEEHNACHGLVYDKEFTLTGSAAGLIATLVKLVYVHDGSLPGYPFPCRVETEYTLNGKNGFTSRTKVINSGRKAMPVGDGWHPFFTFGKRIDDLFLGFRAEKRIVVDERGLPTGATEPFSGFEQAARIGSASFDTCFKLKDEGRVTASVVLEDRQDNAALELWMETGRMKYNYIQIYTPPDRMSIAVEPMTCNIDAFNNGEGLITLEPGEAFEAEYGVRIK